MASEVPFNWAERSGVRSDGEDPYLRVHCVNVFVHDLQRSMRFFLEQLSFVLAYDAHLPGGDRWVAVAPPDGAAVVTLIAAAPGSEEEHFIGRCRLVAFATSDVAAKYDEWQKRGVKFSHPPEEQVWGGVFTRFEDPDGNTFALVSHAEVSREIELKRRAVAEQLEKERRLVQELEIAKSVQARLFPQISPRLRTLEYAGTCLQARKVGGDYYDFLNQGEERIGFILGDIAGKGIAGALLMAHLQATIRSQSGIAFDQPEEFLCSVNRLFFQNSGQSAYATLLFFQYDGQLRSLRFANCGHPSPLLIRSDGKVERLVSTGTVIGLFEKWESPIEERRLSSGDILVLYSDGVTESLNEAEEEYGEQRLTEALLRYRNQPPDELVKSIVSELQRFAPGEQHDDITLIVAKARDPL